MFLFYHASVVSCRYFNIVLTVFRVQIRWMRKVYQMKLQTKLAI